MKDTKIELKEEKENKISIQECTKNNLVNNGELPLFYNHNIEMLTTQSNILNNIGDAILNVADVMTANQGLDQPVLTDKMIQSMENIAEISARAVQPYNNITSGLISVLDGATKTTQLINLHNKLYGYQCNMQTAISAMDEYAANLTDQWYESIKIQDVAERSMAAQNIAMLRLAPDYESLQLPRGGKSVLKALSLTAAKKLTQTDKIYFDPKEKEFHHVESPELKVTANQITVLESSQDLFAEISFDELISFESYLFENMMLALNHKVGKKIYDIINGWNKFIDFDNCIYYHARQLTGNNKPFLDQEMLKAPINLSSHGRYNEIGRSCYYVSENKEGAIREIKKHCGGTKACIQVAGLRPIKHAKIIDLSMDVNGTNRFIEHMRYTVDNQDGKIIKEYLLPNFVAACCKSIGIEGIKYKSTGYNCYVLWKDDYFEFVDGSREIFEEN